MKSRGDIYPYCAKALLLNAEDGKYSAEKDFLQGVLQAGGTVCAEEHVCARVQRAMEGERNHLTSVPLQLSVLIATGVTQIRHRTKLSKGQETTTGEYVARGCCGIVSGGFLSC